MEDNTQTIDEEKEPTKELKELKDLEERYPVNKDADEKEDTKKIAIQNAEDTMPKEKVEANYQESQKETKEESINDNKNIEKEIEKIKEISSEKDFKDGNEKRPKKVLLLVIGIVLILIVAIVLVLALAGKSEGSSKKTGESEVDNKKYSSYVTAVMSALEDGTLDDELKNALSHEGISSDTVELISIDIDADNEQELVAYAGGSNGKYIFHFEVDDSVYYEDSYQLEAKSSLGFVYSMKDEEYYWYTKSPQYYTILGRTKLVIKEEDFLQDYFAITSDYDSKPFLDSAIEYKFDKKLNVEKIEKHKITTDDILKDLKTTKEKIKEAAKNYKDEKEKAEQKLKEEEEAKKKQEEEEQKAKENSHSLNGNLVRFGTYLPSKEGDVKKLTFNKDGTGTINGKACSWTEKDKTIIADEEVAVIEFDCHGNKYDFTSFNNNTLTNGTDIELAFEDKE